MKLEIYNEATGIWKRAASKTAPKHLRFELELNKKLLNFLQVGNYYYLIFNYTKNDLDFISDNAEAVMGYSISEEYNNIPFIINKIHPDDRPYVLNYESRAMEFLISLPVDKLLNYKIMYDYRVQKKNGDYLRILQQGLVLEHDKLGRIIRSLVIHTDITHLKPTGRPILSFIGLDGNESYIDVNAKKLFAVNEFFTKREKQILMLLMEGKLSKEISAVLNINKQTVDRHRKNMIAKNNVNNTNELIAKAITHGWI